MIALHDVRKQYGSTVAVDGVQLTLTPGTTTTLIGPSGCGKSTLIRMMNGLVEPDRGSVTIDGTRVEVTNVRSLRHRIGYVIQEGGLFPHLRAENNLALLPRHLGWSSERIAARIKELADLVGLTAAQLTAWPTQLSGGQRQRVSLMRALMLDPPMLLLDEPLGALDPMIRARLQEDLRRIFRMLKKTVVLVTHDLAEAHFFSDSIVLLRAGRVEQVGLFSDFRDTPASAFVSEFVAAQRALPFG